MNIDILILVPSVISIFIILFLFYKKSKKVDKSISLKIIEILRKEYPIIIGILLLLFIFNYMYYMIYIVNLSKDIFCRFIWNQCNSFLLSVKDILGRMFKLLFQTDILKIIIIGYFINKILINEDIFERLKYFISQIKELNVLGKVSLKISQAEEEKNNAEKEIETIEKKREEGEVAKEEAELKIKENKLKSEIIAILLDNKEIVNYLNAFINNNTKRILVPKNMIPDKILMAPLERLFLYELGVNSIKLLGIKPDIYSIVVKTYDELLSKGIIYCKDK